jgi:hypothetical protein
MINRTIPQGLRPESFAPQAARSEALSFPKPFPFDSEIAT